MNENSEVWIVRGYSSLPSDYEAPEIVYSHAFATHDDAAAMQRRGETELPNIYWTVDRMPYANTEYAGWVFDQLVFEITTEGVK